MWHDTFVVAHTNVDGWFAKMDRFQLAMNICDMDQRDISKGIKFKQLILGKALLCRQTRPIAETGCAHQRRGCHTNL